MKRFFLLVFLGLLGLGCNKMPQTETAKPKKNLSLASLKLPEGFSIEVYAENVPNARQMALSPQGTLYVGSRDEGKVYAIRDDNQDGKADHVFTIAKDLNLPSGLTFFKGALYVAEVSKIWRYDGIEGAWQNPPKPVLVTDDLPTERHHGWKFIAFGPDEKLYVPVGAPCNVCESEDPIFATIFRMNADGSGREIVAKGVRNSVGFDWHPKLKTLWFTDNGRDLMGEDLPPDELNQVTAQGQHFGFPYCHAGEISDPEFGKKQPCSAFQKPAQKLGAHVASIGMRFYTGMQFPEAYHNQVFIAEHGSWNREKKNGYRVSVVKLNEKGEAIHYEPFVDGFMRNEETYGRPADVLVMPDGSLLISDDYADKIYRVTYRKPA